MVGNYGYDAGGNLISKWVGDSAANRATYTWYVRDAQGNTLSTYSGQGNMATVPAVLTQTDVHLYGSSRIGVMNRGIDAKASLASVDTFLVQRGWKLFEISNHLGNVLATVTDRKQGHSSDGTSIDYYTADVATVSDYYPFGMLMPGRQLGQGTSLPGTTTTGSTTVNGYQVPVDMTVTERTGSEPVEYVAGTSVEFNDEFESLAGDAFEAYIADGSYAGTGNVMGGMTGSAGRYRYGFNGKENDNEVSGSGNQYDYGFRIYDPRLGRFLSVDPLSQSYPWYTPYQFAGNKPIESLDLDGLEDVSFHYLNLDGYRTKIAVTTSTITSVPKMGTVERYFNDKKVAVKNWWRQWVGKDVLAYTDLDDAVVLAFDAHITGEEADDLDRALAIGFGVYVPAEGNKIGKYAIKSTFRKALKARGLSDVVSEAILERSGLRSALKIAKGATDVAHHIIPIKVLTENKVVQAAVDAGLDFNSATNGIIGKRPSKYTLFVLIIFCIDAVAVQLLY